MAPVAQRRALRPLYRRAPRSPALSLSLASRRSPGKQIEITLIALTPKSDTNHNHHAASDLQQDIESLYCGLCPAFSRLHNYVSLFKSQMFSLALHRRSCCSARTAVYSRSSGLLSLAT